MHDQGTTAPGLRDVIEEDRKRRATEADEIGDEALTAFVSQRRPATAEWLRSPAAYNELKRHHLTDEAGLCGCSERYTSHVRHILEALALVAER